MNFRTMDRLVNLYYLIIVIYCIICFWSLTLIVIVIIVIKLAGTMHLSETSSIWFYEHSWKTSISTCICNKTYIGHFINFDIHIKRLMWYRNVIIIIKCILSILLFNAADMYLALRINGRAFGYNVIWKNN